MSYKQLKRDLLSTPEGTVESFKMEVAFALHDWQFGKDYDAEQVCEILNLSVKDYILLQTGELDLTLSQVLKITKVIGVKVDIRLQDIDET